MQIDRDMEEATQAWQDKFDGLSTREQIKELFDKFDLLQKYVSVVDNYTHAHSHATPEPNTPIKKTRAYKVFGWEIRLTKVENKPEKMMYHGRDVAKDSVFSNRRSL